MLPVCSVVNNATDMSSTSPIFIAGCGRSGTTYLQTIVDAHPAVFIPT